MVGLAPRSYVPEHRVVDFVEEVMSRAGVLVSKLLRLV